MTTDYKPEPVKKLTDLEAIKVLSDPKRLEILEVIHNVGHALSVKQMAEELKVDPRKLYYHIRLLEQHGILVVTETQIVANIAEKFYHVAAYTFDVAPTAFNFEDDDNPIHQTLELLFDNTKFELLNSVRHGLIKHDGGADSLPSNIGRATYRLNKEQAFEFITRLQELLQFFDDASTGNEKDRDLYLFSFAFFPTHPSSDTDDSEEQ